MMKRLRALIAPRLGGGRGVDAGKSAVPPQELHPDTPEVLKTPEARFWKWFTDNQTFIEQYAVTTDAVMDAVQAQINTISPHLAFEIGQTLDGVYEFIISAGGVKRLIPAVTHLYNAAPPIAGWQIIAFKPRHATPQIEYGGEKFAIADFFYTAKDGEEGKTDLLVCIRGYSRLREKTFGMVGFLFLDTVIGEYDVMTNLGMIEFGDIPPGPLALSGLKPLKDLAPDMDARKPNAH